MNRLKLFSVLVATAVCVCSARAVGADTLVGWALPQVSVACMREEPRHGAEMCSQVVMGTPLKIDSIAGQWCRVTTPEGYHGWIIDNSLHRLTDAQFDDWRSARRLVVRSFDQVWVFDNDSILAPTRRLSDLVNGAILYGVKSDAALTLVGLPDGREGYVDSSVLSDIEAWGSHPFDERRLLEFARSMMGQPYLWGGTSTKGNDCSGLTKVIYYDQGIILPRDANQQALVGQPLDVARPDGYRRGDLLFYGNAQTGRITHVAVYDADGVFVHCSGRVRENSVEPASGIYCGEEPLAAVRIVARESAPAQLMSNNHPWYFNK